MLRRAALLALMLSNASCATIFTGNTQEIHIRPYPPDTRIIVDNDRTFEGYASIELERGTSHTLRFEREGYEARSILIEPSMNGVLWLNLLWGPAFFFGFFVDAVSGAATWLAPGEIDVDLVRAPVAIQPAETPPLPAPPEPPPVPAVPTAPAAPAAPAETDPGWVVAVTDVDASSRPDLGEDVIRGLGDQIRIALAARRVKVLGRGAPAGTPTHILRSSVARFGTACTTNGELVDVARELTIAAGSARGGCEEEALLDAAEALAEQLIARSRR